MIPLETGEKVVIEIRKHWFVFFKEAFFLMLLLLIPITAYSFIEIPSFVKIPGNIHFLFMFFVAIWLLFIWVLFFLMWTYQYLDVWVVTNKRIIDIEQISLFSRDVSFFRLEKIQDVTSEVRGIIPTLLNYGTVYIQTAGESKSRELKLSYVPHPEKLKQMVNELQDKALSEYRGQASSEIIDH